MCRLCEKGKDENVTPMKAIVEVWNAMREENKTINEQIRRNCSKEVKAEMMKRRRKVIV